MNKTAVIFEDHKITADSLKSFLLQNGFDSAHIFSNALDGIEFIKKNHPDLILMDIILEGSINGIEATQIIKEFYRIPIIFLTADDNPLTFQQAKEKGADGYWLKKAGCNDNFLYQIEIILDRYSIERSLLKESEVNKLFATVAEELISKDLSIPNIAFIINNYCRKITNSAHGYVGTIDPINGDLVSHTLTEMMEGMCKIKDANIIFPKRGDGYNALWGHSLQTKKGFFTNSPNQHFSSKGIPLGHIPLFNYLSVPAIINDEIVGQISLANSVRDYTDDDIEIIQKFADLYAAAINRKRTEDFIKKSEEELKEIQRIAGLGSYTIYLESNICKGNFIYGNLIGLDGETEFKTELWKNIIHPEDYPNVIENYQKCIGNKHDIQTEYRIINLKNKEIKWLSVLGKVIYDPFDKPIQIRGTSQDIDRKSVV